MTDPVDERFPIVLGPVRATRVAYAIAGIFLIVAGLVFLLVGALAGLTLAPWLWTSLLIGVATTGYGVIVTARGARMSVTLTRDAATVRGMLGSRTIPREQIADMTTYPSLVWTDIAGRKRKTPINALNVYRRSRAMPTVLAQIDGMTQLLAHWVHPKG